LDLGIAIHHVRDVAKEDREVRSDVTAFVGVVIPGKWPKQARAGDFIELPVDSAELFARHPTAPFFDAATRVAIEAFFLNGGRRCVAYGLCVEGEQDLIDPVRLQTVTAGLLERMREDEEPALLVVPPLAYLPNSGRGPTLRVGAHAAVRLFLKHCREMTHRFMVLDAPRHTSEEILAEWITQLRRDREIDCSYGALYFPWLQRGDTAVPPSGVIAGTYARVEAENAPFGVRVSPANVPVRGFTHPQVPLSFRDSAALVEAGINPILEQPGRGMLVWGARTLSNDPRWRQITSRRIVSLVTERVRRDAEWVVFEHQRPELWQTVARMVRSRLDAFWSAGLLTGESAGSEYLVQCDEELNPPAVRDAGQVHFKVLLRPVSSTEFIEVELSLGA
jgi:hypothetical protein